MSDKPKRNNPLPPIINRTIGDYDAKSQLPEILRQVAQGHSFTITNHGKAVADITPSYADETRIAQAAINNILNMERVEISDEQLMLCRTEGRK